MSAVMDEEIYLPQQGRIVESYSVTEREKYLRLELDRPLGHRPGQFVMLTVPGVGESAISISCGPHDGTSLEMVIRNAGSVTGVIHAMEEGSYLGVRGPYGHGFPIEEFAGKQLLIVAGGLGLVPLRSLIEPMMAHHGDYAAIDLIVGARTPAETLFRDQIAGWRALDNVSVTELVDRTEHQPWDGGVGLVTQPIGGLELDGANTVVVLCGPPVMYKFVIMELAMHHAIPREQIFVDLERRMKCGVGKCGHCQINHLYCCRQGPVFRLSDLDNAPEAL